MKSINNKQILILLQEFNNFVAQMDDKVIKLKKQYDAKCVQANEQQKNTLRKFESECDSNIMNIDARSKEIIKDAKSIQAQINQMDKHLLEIDKYYVKTKKKKEESLKNEVSAKYKDANDYFKTLQEMKEQFNKISKKYSEDILPGLLNGLNYMFSGKRKKEYEELIVLKNTVSNFIDQMKDDMKELSDETISEMKTQYANQKNDLINSQQNFKEQMEKDYFLQMEKIKEEISVGLEQLFPDDLLKNIFHLVENYKKNYGKVTKSIEGQQDVMYLGNIEYPMIEFIQSTEVISLVAQRCKSMIENEKIKFPILFTGDSTFSLLVKKGDNRAKLQQFMQGIMFSFLSTVPVNEITLSVIDVENHGNSVDTFFEAKKKLPELFENKFYTSSEEAKQKIRNLNEKVEYISQEILGTGYQNIFEYKKENPNTNYKIELLTIFDFPKGLDEQSISYLRNIIEYGTKCGIYVMISGLEKLDSNTTSKELIANIEKLQSLCQTLIQTGNGFSMMGLDYTSNSMPSKVEFNNFLERYMLIAEGIKNQGIALPKNMKELMEANNETELQKCIEKVHEALEKYDGHYGKVPELTRKYPEQIPIGLAHYPQDLFAECYGYETIKKEFLTENQKIRFPLMMDLGANCNILLSYDEAKSEKMLNFVHNLMWNFLSEMPVTKTNIAVMDVERKGQNMLPFLDFKKDCPEVFDENIYTNSDEIYKRLQKLNRDIDDMIQNKLSNRYSNLLDYNRKTPNRAEAITLLTIFDFPSGFDGRSIELLMNILKNGGKCGIYTLIGFNKDITYSSYEGIDKFLQRIKENSSNIEITDKGYTLAPFNLPVTIKLPLNFAQAEQFVTNYKETMKKIKGKGLSFDDILDKELFKRNFENGIQIPIGVGDGDAIIPLIMGVKSSHHLLIGGATGGGKSTLLHTLIMSAMLHYTPDLLNLYLMDFKSGTEFKIYDKYRLPHIKLIALDAMQEFGESILENLVDEMTKRGELFKSVNASTIGEYVKISGKPMPKILIIMDEFQILYNYATNRKVANHVAELTKRIVTEGRSYGIHLIMATQSMNIIRDLTLARGTIEQMRIRIGLKCGEADANYLFSDRNYQKALEMMKGPIGTAVLNEEYTEQDNIGFRAAYCDSETQEKYLKQIEKEFQNYEANTQSFEAATTEQLLSILNSEEAYNDLPVKVNVGTLIKVADPFKAIFDKKHKHNILICGANEKMAENISNLYILGLLLNPNTKILCIDGEVILGEEKEDSYQEEFERFGERFKLARTRADIIKFVNEAYEFYEESKKNITDKNVMIMIKNFQYLDLVKSMLKGEKINEEDYIEAPKIEEEKDNNPFNFNFPTIKPATANVSGKIVKLIDDGAAYGINFLLSSLEFQSVKENMYYGENILPKFQERFIFSLNDNEADFLGNGISVDKLRENIVYYTDSVKNTFQIKPYVFPSKNELKEFLDRRIEKRGEL